jgi:hypothetical protein
MGLPVRARPRVGSSSDGRVLDLSGARELITSPSHPSLSCPRSVDKKDAPDGDEQIGTGRTRVRRKAVPDESTLSVPLIVLFSPAGRGFIAASCVCC